MIPHDTRNVRGMVCVTFGKTARGSHGIMPLDEVCAVRAFLRSFIVTANRPVPQAVSTVSRNIPPPIFKKKAPHNHLTPPSILRKLAFLNRWGAKNFTVGDGANL